MRKHPGHSHSLDHAGSRNAFEPLEGAPSPSIPAKRRHHGADCGTAGLVRSIQPFKVIKKFDVTPQKDRKPDSSRATASTYIWTSSATIESTPATESPSGAAEYDNTDRLNITHASDHATLAVPPVERGSPMSEYDLDEVTEEEIGRLSEKVGIQEKHQAPPSSVLRSMERLSRDVEDFDPNLQRSSPANSKTDGLHRLESEQTRDAEADLMDSDINWEAIMGQTCVSSPESCIIQEPQEVAASDNSPLPPFARPPFPPRVRDKSFVGGISNQTVVRTCFRTGELLNEGVRCSRSHQKAILELFARVTYSSRETDSRRQHFQFVDRFREQQPYLLGVMNGWKPGSLLDRQANDFIGREGQMKMCRCVCTLQRDAKADVGWALAVISIRKTSWDEVSLLKQIVASSVP